MNQGFLWQNNVQSAQYAELCNALYERELKRFAQSEQLSSTTLSARLTSLPHYIKRTAYNMLQSQSQSPLTCDLQNASWFSNQPNKMPLTGQTEQEISAWYFKETLPLGLVVPILLEGQLCLDSIDRIDNLKKRIRCNANGWYSFTRENLSNNRLLKPNKKVMMSACCGHFWREGKKAQPIQLSLRELLLSTQINWSNYRKTCVK